MEGEGMGKGEVERQGVRAERGTRDTKQGVWRETVGEGLGKGEPERPGGMCYRKRTVR